jgi:transcriptional regulator with XRE-family HTH domain
MSMPMPHTPAPPDVRTVLALQRDFGLALRKARESRRHPLAVAADRFGLSVRSLASVERGELLIDNIVFIKMRGSYAALSPWGPKLAQARRQLAEASAAAGESAPPPSPPRLVEAVPEEVPDVRQARTFGEALRMLRDHERLSQAELAHCLSLHPTAVSQWESGINAPIRKHYEALLTLLPRLLLAPVPAWQEMAKPGPSPASVWPHIALVPPPAPSDLVVVSSLPPAAAPSPESPPPMDTAAPSSPPAVASPPPGATMKDLLALLALLRKVSASADFERFQSLLVQSAASGLSCADLLAALETV